MNSPRRSGKAAKVSEGSKVPAVSRGPNKSSKSSKSKASKASKPGLTDVSVQSKSGASGGKVPRLSLTIQEAFADPALPIDRPRLRRWVRAAIERDARLLFRFVDRAEGRALNREFRQRDKPTNVLTFDYAHEPVIEADIVICVPVVLAEARQGRLSAADHLAHLVIHGVLHAQGHDHEDDIEAQAMESTEIRLLRRFRIADPYQDE